MSNPLICERCGGELESNDALSIIRGVCGWCRRGEPRPINELNAGTPDFSVAAPDTPHFAVAEPESPSFESAEFPSEDAPPRSSRRRRDLAIGTVVGLILTVGVAGYLMVGTGRQTAPPPTEAGFPVTLTVTPPSAAVSLDDLPIGPPDSDGRLGFTIPKDDAATHWLDVTADGFHEVRRPISIHGDRRDISVILIRKPYDLIVRSEPPSAEVWLNEERVGETPVSIAVPHSLGGQMTVKHPGYRPMTRDISPPTPGTELEFDLVLEAAAPVIRVESDPPGAEILANGHPVGVAPASLELPDANWGDSVAISATMTGYVDASKRLLLPEQPGETPDVQLRLTRTPITVTVNTDPSGGTVAVDGHSLGPAPAVATFPSERSGQTVVFEALQPGVRYGSAEFRIPSAGENAALSVPMQFHGRRVVFVYVPPADSSGLRDEKSALADRILDRIHGLQPLQQFALLTYTKGGVEAWPGGTEFANASSEQKVRAFDQVRSTRTTDRCEVTRLLEAARDLEPEVLWMFLPGDTDLDPIRTVEFEPGDRTVSVNVVAAALGPAQSWLAQWTIAHHGTLSVIEGGADAMLAGEIGEGER